MGVIKRGVLGGFSGKVANVVGSSWKGIAVMKSLPLSVANPKTTGQVNQRTKFSAAVAMAKLLLASIVKPLNDRFAQAQSGYNAWISRNIGAFSTSGVPTYANIKMSEGSMTPTAIEPVTAQNGSSGLTVPYSDDASGNQLASDIPYVAVYNATQEEWSFSASDGLRSNGFVNFSVPPLATGDELHIYLSFLAADGSKVSTSSYLAKTVTA